MANNNKSPNVDSGQVLKNAYDATEEALRFVPSGATGFDIELSHSDGDSIYSHLANSSNSASVTPSSSGIIIAEQACEGKKSFQLYAKSLAALGGAAQAKIEVSPADSGDVWFDMSLSLTSSTSLNAVVASSVGNQLARRIRVSLVTAPVGGNVDYYLIMSA
jgi:hypothetical protein